MKKIILFGIIMLFCISIVEAKTHDLKWFCEKSPWYFLCKPLNPNPPHCCTIIHHNNTGNGGGSNPPGNPGNPPQNSTPPNGQESPVNDLPINHTQPPLNESHPIEPPDEEPPIYIVPNNTIHLPDENDSIIPKTNEKSESGHASHLNNYANPKAYWVINDTQERGDLLCFRAYQRTIWYIPDGAFRWKQKSINSSVYRSWCMNINEYCWYCDTLHRYGLNSRIIALQ